MSKKRNKITMNIVKYERIDELPYISVNYGNKTNFIRKSYRFMKIG